MYSLMKAVLLEHGKFFFKKWDWSQQHRFVFWADYVNKAEESTDYLPQFKGKNISKNNGQESTALDELFMSWWLLKNIVVKNIKRMILFCGMWKPYEIHILVPINKNLSEYSHTHLFTYVHVCLHAAMTELERLSDPQTK